MANRFLPMLTENRTRLHTMERMMKLPLALLMLCAAQLLFAASTGQWRPEIKFKLESANHIETLTWISGFSYALTESAKEMRKLGLYGPYCLPSSGVIGSKEIVEVLNERFAGTTITSEIAAGAAMQKIKVTYSCNTIRPKVQ